MRSSTDGPGSAPTGGAGPDRSAAVAAEVAQEKAETLVWLRRISGDLATATIQRLEETLPWYAEMPPARRSAVGLVAQAGITSFLKWFEEPASTPAIAADIFAAAPRELLRSVSLTQTLQLVRVTVEVMEERVAGRSERVREAMLSYSREVAFAAADVYARAAEARGLWDARLEALVVDSILTGEADDELPSRIAALGWHGHGEVSVLVGTTPPQLDVDQVRRTARKLGVDVLIGVQGSRLVLVLGRADLPARAGDDVTELAFTEIAKRLEPSFGSGHLVLGPAVPPSSTRARAPAPPSPASPSPGRGATPRVPSRPTTCCPSGLSRETRSPSRPSSTASTAPCRRTAPTSSRRSGATSTTAGPSRRRHASCTCTRTRCGTA